MPQKPRAENADHVAPPDYYYPQVAHPNPTDPLPHRVRKADYFRDPKNFFGINVTEVETTFGPHWHPNSDEFDYFLQGSGIVEILGPGDTEPVAFEVTQGDAIVIPQGFVHFYRNTSDEDPLVFLAVFNNSEFRAIDSATVPSIGSGE